MKTCSQMILEEMDSNIITDYIYKTPHEFNLLLGKTIEQFFVTDYYLNKWSITSCFLNIILWNLDKGYKRYSDKFDKYTIAALMQYHLQPNFTKFDWDYEKILVNSNATFSKVSPDDIIEIDGKKISFETLLKSFCEKVKKSYNTTDLTKMIDQALNTIGLASLTVNAIIGALDKPISTAISSGEYKFDITKDQQTEYDLIVSTFRKKVSDKALRCSFEDFVKKTINISIELKFRPLWLMVIMYLESGCRPGLTNDDKTATGLIQFRTSFIKPLGVTQPEIQAMNGLEQLDLVKKFMQIALKNNKKALTFMDVRMLIFRPADRFRADTFVWARKGKQIYTDHLAMDTDKDDKITLDEFKRHTYDRVARDISPQILEEVKK